MSSTDNTEKPVEETKTEVCGYHFLWLVEQPAFCRPPFLAPHSNVTERRVAAAAAPRGKEKGKKGAHGKDKTSLGSLDP